mmetsp:Transcript_13648/g.29553  ORF Transcript_13648/g.29553 Transcript_13648/m.29553 type:complete len:210 (-) Transcript_13648:1048-1677(-)
MHSTRRHRVERQVKLIIPAELKSSFRQRVVPLLRVWVTLCQVCSMRRNLVRDDTSFDIVPVRKSQMLFRSHVAQQSAALMTDICRSNRARDVIIAGCNVSDERSERVERCFRAPIQLILHILRDFVDWNVARPFVHHLHVEFPRTSCQFALSFELSKLCLIVCVEDGARTKSIPDREGHVVLAADFTNLVPVLVRKVFFVMREAPLGVD